MNTFQILMRTKKILLKQLFYTIIKLEMIWRMQRSLEQNAELQWETKLSNFGVLFRLFFLLH